MGDLISVISIVIVGIAVIAFIIIMAKKRLDAISDESFSVDMDMQTDEALSEVSAGKKGDPVDVLFESPHYDEYETLFNYIWSACHGRDDSQYKIDLLLQSLDMGRVLGTDGVFYVMESIKKDLPYFCETEHEFEMFFKSPAPVLQGSVRGVLDMISFYLFKEKNPSKQEYWKQLLLKMAQDGNFEAQAALCTNFAKHAFSEQELAVFKEMYEPALMRLAEEGNGEAQLAVGEFLMRKPPEKIAWLTKAAEQGLSDAWYQLGLTYESMIDTDDDGQFRRDCLSDDEVHQLMVKKAEYFLKGAHANNGIMAAWCQYKVGDYYEEGRLLPKDLQKAAYWLRRAIENGEDAEGSLEYVLRQMV